MAENNEEEKLMEKKAVEERPTPQLAPFIGRDLKETYQFFLNKIPENPQKKYDFLIKLLSIGKALIPSPISEFEEKRFNHLKKRIQDVLLGEKLGEIKQDYGYADHGDIRYPCYILSASDMKTKSYVREEKLQQYYPLFKDEQCNVHIPELQKVQNLLLHVLTAKKVIIKNKPTPEETIEEFVNIILKKKMDEIKDGL